jgi:hypothetical protein
MDSHRLAQRLLAEENMEVSVSVDIGSDSNPDIRAFGEGLDEVAESGGFMNLCFADGSTNENTTLTHRISKLEAERDEADRRAGLSERMLASYVETKAAHGRWNSKAKAEAGYCDSVSFDTVWAETLDNARKYVALTTNSKGE